MYDRFKFRAYITVLASDGNGGSKDFSFYVYNIGLFGNEGIGFTDDELDVALEKTNFSEIEKEDIKEELDNYKNEFDYYNYWVDSIEQCTGLKDKNGNLIYEGDIVKDSLLGRKYTVNWDCDNVQFEAIANVYDTEFSEVYGLYVDSAKELEIIGNIHEREEGR